MGFHFSFNQDWNFCKKLYWKPWFLLKFEIISKYLPLMRSFYNTNVRGLVANAPNTGTEQSQYHLTWLPEFESKHKKRVQKKWEKPEPNMENFASFNYKYNLLSTCIPSTPLIPIPMSASWSIPTSLAPSPIASVVFPVPSLTRRVTCNICNTC